MISATELEWLRRALTTLETDDCTAMAQAKILRIMAQICDRGATKIETDLVDRVTDRLYNNDTVKGATYA